MQADYPEEYDRLAQSENPLRAVLEELETRGLLLRKLREEAVPQPHFLGRIERRTSAANRQSLGSDCGSSSSEAAAVLSLSPRSPVGRVQGGPVRHWNLVLTVGPTRDRLLARREKLQDEYQEALKVWSDEVRVWRECLLAGGSTWPDLRAAASQRVEKVRAELEQLDNLLEDPAA